MRDFIFASVAFLAAAGLGYLYFSGQGAALVSGSGSVTEVGEAGFDRVIGNSQGPVLVDFAADWCGPCRQMEPVLNRLATEFEGRATIIRVDVDDSPELAARFNVRSMPTFMVFKDGSRVYRSSGTASKAKLAEILRSFQ